MIADISARPTEIIAPGHIHPDMQGRCAPIAQGRVAETVWRAVPEGPVAVTITR